MDFNMPIMDGCEASAQIRGYLHKNRLVQPLIIGSSGQTEDYYVKQAIQSGMNSVISKPLNLALVKRILKQMNYI